ncbi:hypothetical protein [Salinibaculum rarum]|uniref:hypothetical protein n=1 Tax=Salinibaculum rarum TaxID=3058903 RepID=UPI00265FF7E3|nr:hypothetical protein [Salinibaculum sp. KK48]
MPDASDSPPDSAQSTSHESSPDDSDDNAAGEETVQEMLESSMPSFPEDRREMPDADDFRMTVDEQQQIHDLFDGLVHTLYDRGYTPSELGVILNGLEHRMNASRFDPYEYDRIALSLRLRETVEEWRAEQDAEIPVVEIAEVIEELGRHYRDVARKELYQDGTSEDNADDNEAGDADA